MKNVDTNMETRTRVPTYFKEKTLTSKKADKRNYHISQLVHELQYVFKRSLCKLRNTPKKKKITSSRWSYSSTSARCQHDRNQCYEVKPPNNT